MSLALAQYGFGVMTFLAGGCCGWIASAIYNALTSRRKHDSRGRFIKQHAK